MFGAIQKFIDDPKIGVTLDEIKNNITEKLKQFFGK